MPKSCKSCIHLGFAIVITTPVRIDDECHFGEPVVLTDFVACENFDDGDIGVKNGNL